MTTEELKNFEKLHDTFIKDCERVCNILRNSKERTRYDGYNIAYADRFILEDGYVHWEGDEDWNYGGHEHHSDVFPANFLTMSDDELMSIVDKENAKYDKEQESKNRKIAETEKAERFEQYKKLKEEFENNQK